MIPRRPERATGRVPLRLDTVDEAFGREVAEARQASGRLFGMENRNATVGVLTDRDVDLVGARAEVAACRAYGLDPREHVRTAPERMHEPDVGGVDVRGTVHATGHLLVYDASGSRPGDRDDRAFALVTVPPYLGGVFHVVGWAFGWQVRAEGVYDPPTLRLRLPAWALQQGRLIDPAWLPIARA